MVQFKATRQALGDSGEVFRFEITARQLVELCVVERFGQDDNGVQRPLKEKHVLRVAEAMADPEHLWLEPIIGAMYGNWDFDEASGTLSMERSEEVFISLDDGQHRRAAIESGLLDPDEIDKLVFSAVVYRGLSYEQRLKIFRMQAGRTAIDPTLDLAQRSRLDSWNSATDKNAYEIVKWLATDPESPFFGQVQITPGKTETFVTQNGVTNKLTAAALFPAIRSALQRRSRLSQMRFKHQKVAIVAMIAAAKKTWPSHWGNPNSSLTTANGMKALLNLFISGINFREEVGKNYTKADISKAIALGSSFRWGKRYTSNKVKAELSNAIDNAIRRGSERAAKAKQ